MLRSEGNQLLGGVHGRLIVAAAVFAVAPVVEHAHLQVDIAKRNGHVLGHLVPAARLVVGPAQVERAGKCDHVVAAHAY